MSKANVLSRLVENGVVAVLRKVPEDKVEKLAEALINGGVNALEVTVDVPGGYRMIEKLALKYGDQAVIGAGTVIDHESAKSAIDSGASFIVSPILNKEVIQTTLRYGRISVPAAMTPSEAIQAVEYGADIVKLFPASAVGHSFIKNIKGPLPQVQIIPTGGIDVNNAADYIKAGAIAIGAGSNLVDNKLIEADLFGEIEAKAKEYVDVVRSARLDANFSAVTNR